MGQTGRYFDQLEGVFGKGNVTSGYRSQEEQDALVRRGATKATRSSHTYKDGYDLKIGVAKTPEELHKRLTDAGHQVRYIRRESGHGKNQGTGPHWHIELGAPGKEGTRMAGGSNQGSAKARNDVLDIASHAARTPQTSPGPRSSQGVGVGPTDAVFGSDSKFVAGYDKLNEQIETTGQKIDVLSIAQNVAHATQMGAKQEQVRETRAISDEITGATEALKRQVQPVFAARQRVNDQLDQLTTMNPIERGIRGIFDLNYDRQFLTGQLDSYDRTLKSRADDFNYLNHLNDVAMREIDRRYALNTAETDLIIQQGKEELGLLGQSMANTNAMLGSLEGEWKGQMQMVQAKQAARGDLLSRLDMATISDLKSQAVQAGGMIEFQGMDFSAQELHDMLVKNEGQELSLESHRNAVENQNLALAERHAANVVQYMTRAELEGAMNNGFVHKGIALPRDAVTSAYMREQQLDASRAESYLQANQAKSVWDYITNDANRNVAIYNRASGMFGPQANRQVQSIFENQTSLYKELTEARRSGQPDMVINAIQAKIAKNSEGIQDQIDKVILDNAGGDKRAAGYIRSFVNGTPMNAGTATEAMTYFAIKGGMPEGVMASPEARQIFQKAQTVVSKYQGEKGMTEQRLRQLVAKEVGEAAFTTVGNVRFSRLWESLPALAKKAGHAAGSISQQQWELIESKSNQAAVIGIAPKLSTSVDNVKTMIRTGRPISDSGEHQKLFTEFQKAGADMNAYKVQETIKILDEDMKAITPGTKNSDLVIGFLRSPQAQEMAGVYTQTSESNGMGDFLIGPMARGAFERQISVKSKLLEDTSSFMTAQQQSAARRLDSAWAGNPTGRSLAILGSIPGVGKEGAGALLPFIQEVTSRPGMAATAGAAQGVMSATPGAGGIGFSAGSLVEQQEQQIHAALQSHKFDDPRLEGFRRAAVKGWEHSKTQTEGFLDILLDAMKPKG